MGVVQSKELALRAFSGEPLDLNVSSGLHSICPKGTAPKVLEALPKGPMHMALVVDEYGGFKGLVTLNDLLASIVGELDVASEGQEPGVVRQRTGPFSWTAYAGGRSSKDLDRPASRARRKVTSAPWRSWMMQLGLPKPSDHFHWNGFRFEVVDMDGRRVDKVLVRRRCRAQPE